MIDPGVWDGYITTNGERDMLAVRLKTHSCYFSGIGVVSYFLHLLEF